MRVYSGPQMSDGCCPAQARKQATTALRPDDLDIIDDDMTTHGRRNRPTRYLETLVRCIVAAVVQASLSNSARHGRIPKDHIAVRTDGYAAVPLVHVKCRRTVCRGKCDELSEIDAHLDDAFGKQDRQPRLESRSAVRDPAEPRAALGDQLDSLVVVAERGMIGRERLERPVLKANPAADVARFVALQRAEHVLRALHVETFQIPCRQH